MLTTSVERLEADAVKLTVTVPAAEVDAAVERAYKSVGKKVKVPGFRPGKAPRAVLDSMLGREYILSEATEDVVNRTYPRAFDAEGLRPIESPEIDELETVEPGADFTYVAGFDVRPELELASVDSFEVTVPAQEASDADIDAQIEQLRDRFATLDAVTDRAIEDGDFVLLSFVGTVDGEAYEGNEVDRYLYETGRGLMPAEFDQALIGAEAGAEVHVEFTVPDTTNNPDFAGKTAAFDITIHEIKAKVLPELDDEFAGNVGFDTIAELRDDVKGRLDVQLKSSFDRVRDHRLREAVAERLKGDVPESLVSNKAQSLTRDFVDMLERQGLTLQSYLDGSGIDENRFFEDMAEQAAIIVREELALEALSRAKGLDVTDEDLDAEFAAIGEAAGITAEKARERWVELGFMSALRGEMMQRAAFKWLSENATQVTGSASAADTEE